MRFLDRMRRDAVPRDLVMASGEGDLITLEQFSDDANRLGEPLDPNAPRIEAEPGFVIFRFDAAGPEAELQSAVAQQIDGRRFARNQHGMTQIVIENIRADPQPGCRFGGRHHGRHRRDAVGQVVRKGQSVIAERLDFSRLVRELSPRRDMPDADAEPKRSHVASRA